MEIYLVGGAVRDRLLNLDPGERDWVVLGASPEEMRALGFRQLDAEFPVFAHPETGEEYALARREQKAGEGHKGFTVEFGPDVTLEEDLYRRDLRVNAMAESSTGELIDPFEGRADLDARILRHVSEAFVEDPLRVLRAARFLARLAGLGFEIAPPTLALMTLMSASNDMRTLSGGRIWRETEKALSTDHPSRFLSTLRECGALGVVMPEIAREPDLDTAFEVLDISAQSDPRAEIRFAALINACTKMDASATSQLLDKMGQRFPLPKRYSQLARVVPLVCSEKSTDASALYSVMDKADAFRRDHRFADALTVYDALRVRCSGAESASLIRRAFDAAAMVRASDTSHRGARGHETGEELRRLRVQAIENALKSGPR